MTTSTRDDRVHPYHARCFVNRLLDVQKSSSSGDNIEHDVNSKGAQVISYWLLIIDLSRTYFHFFKPEFRRTLYVCLFVCLYASLSVRLYICLYICPSNLRPVDYKNTISKKTNFAPTYFVHSICDTDNFFIGSALFFNLLSSWFSLKNSKISPSHTLSSKYWSNLLPLFFYFVRSCQSRFKSWFCILLWEYGRRSWRGCG